MLVLCFLGLKSCTLIVVLVVAIDFLGLKVTFGCCVMLLAELRPCP